MHKSEHVSLAPHYARFPLIHLASLGVKLSCWFHACHTSRLFRLTLHCVLIVPCIVCATFKVKKMFKMPLKFKRWCFKMCNNNLHVAHQPSSAGAYWSLPLSTHQFNQNNCICSLVDKLMRVWTGKACCKGRFLNAPFFVPTQFKSFQYAL